ncbi:DUF1786 family protein [Candidatus Riflebacteria bacterium]
MKIFALDIGHGTQDMMLFSSEQTIENNPKLVLTTPARVFKKKIEKSNSNLGITGYTIGGGPLKKALKDHLAKGYKIFLEKGPALTIRNNFKQVMDLGFSVCDRLSEKQIQENKLQVFNFNEVNFKDWCEFFLPFNEDLKRVDWLAIAVQDHGMITTKDTSRETRFEVFKNLLQASPYPWSICFVDKEIPESLARHSGARDSAIADGFTGRILTMDTSTAAMYGALLDDYNNWGSGPNLTINMGNNHITAYVVENWRILSFFEHHTPHIRHDMVLLDQYLQRGCAGDLTMEEILATDGSGYYCMEKRSFSKIKNIIVTGPNRDLLRKTRLTFKNAVPGGDMMMSGPLGLIGAIKKIENF